MRAASGDGGRVGCGCRLGVGGGQVLPVPPPFLGSGLGGVPLVGQQGHPLPTPKMGWMRCVGMLVPTQDPCGNGGAEPKGGGRTDGLFVFHLVNTLLGGTKLFLGGRVGEYPKNLIAPQISARRCPRMNRLCGDARLAVRLQRMLRGCLHCRNPVRVLNEGLSDPPKSSPPALPPLPSP